MNKVTWERILGGPLITNVPHLVVHHAADGEFEIQYGGSGPADFALNILEHVLRTIDFEGEKVDCFKGQCYRLAWDRHHEFKSEYLVNAPDKGQISIMEILQFLGGIPLPE